MRESNIRFKTLYSKIFEDPWFVESFPAGLYRAPIVSYLSEVCKALGPKEDTVLNTVLLARLQAELIGRQLSAGLPGELYRCYQESSLNGFDNVEQAIEESEEAMRMMRERFRDAAIYFEGYSRHSEEISLETMFKTIQRFGEEAYHEFHSGTLTVKRLLELQPTWVMQEWHC